MANINNFITDETYRRDILKKVVYQRRTIDNANAKKEFLKDSGVIKISDIIGLKIKNSESDDEFEDRYGDDFEVDQLHYYEDNMIATLKNLIKTNDKYSNMDIIEIYFNCVTKKDFDVKIGGKYSSGWLYVINIKMLIDGKILDYNHISHNMDKYYDYENHILAFDNVLLYNGSDKNFYKQ